MCMVHRLSKMIANFLLHKNVISETEIDIYIYGYETIILGIIDFFIVLIVGLIFNQFITMLIFFTMFISVRWNCQEMCSRRIPKILDRQESGGVMRDLF